tara:strand:- start:139 stop:894 length:756 start_codon:yes stop_codon:yes gene_type:complete
MSEEQQTEVAEETQTELPAAEDRDFVVAEDLEAKPDRPEWLPEKYNSGEDLAKAYKELESKLGTKEEDLREKFLNEVQTEAYKDRPKTSGDYALPDDVIEEAVIDTDFLKWWADHSFENGFSQEEFSNGLNKVINAIESTVPNATEELEKLGDNANSRIEAAALFANQFFPEDHMPSIERLTETADGVVVLEFIMEKMKDPSISSQADSPSKITEQGLREMMQDEKYWHPAKRNNDFINQVNEGFQKLYNT